MKRIILVAYSYLFFANICSAQTVSVQKEFRNDDKLQMQQVSFESVTQVGDKQIGDLRRMDVTDDKYTISYQQVGLDSIVGYEHGTHYIYRQDGSTLQIAGFRNRLVRMDYDLPETWLRFPMKQGDSICGLFHGRGIYSRNLFMRSMGRYRTVADEQGLIILPDGDTLYNAIRLKTEREVTNIYQPLDSILTLYGSLDSVPRFTADSILYYMAIDTMTVKATYFRWYADGYRYPILETILAGSDADVDEGNQEQCFATAFYYPPEVQLWLPLDDENRLIREQLAETAKSQREAKARGKAVELSYSLDNQTGNKCLTVNYTLSRSASVKVLLCNVQGVVLLSAEQSGEVGQNSLTVDYGSLRPGQYVLYINSEGLSYTEKLRI